MVKYDNEYTNYKWLCKNQPRITEGRRLVARVDTNVGRGLVFCLVKQEYTLKFLKILKAIILQGWPIFLRPAWPKKFLAYKIKNSKISLHNYVDNTKVYLNMQN